MGFLGKCSHYIKGMDFNQVVHGDAVEVLQYCPDDSIRACITSPPYANQRQHFYPSISESDYPAWTVHWLEALRPKLPTGALGSGSPPASRRVPNVSAPGRVPVAAHSTAP